MSTGLFSIREGRGGPRKGFIPLNRRRAQRSAVNAFAEAMANGAETVRAASLAVGISERQDTRVWRQIKTELGWQAA